jgi:HD-GYP domain-containing protein (c-di-GMP phosphodiesterase class II)
VSEGMEAVAGRRDEGLQDGEAAERARSRHAAQEALRRIASVASRVLDVEEVVVLLRERGPASSLVVVARHGRADLPLVAWRAEDGAVERALAAEAPAADGEQGRRRQGAAAPVMVNGELRGVLAVSAPAPARPFGGEQLELLTELADLASTSLEQRDLRERAEAAVDAGTELLARAVDMRDEYTGRHSAQVGTLARRVGRRIGMPSPEIDELACAARLHDVGKLGVPDAILQKAGPLDESEWAVMRRHPEWGAEMVGRVPGLERMATLVRAHHERWDGGGYPEGLAGKRIPLASRVIGVCDAFAAMVSRRPYRAALTVEAALAELTAGAGSQFDPVVVAAVEDENAADEPSAGAGLA